MRCVITDDEPIALEILEDYINMVPGLNLIAKCRNAMETFIILKQEKVDILFIDIKMPGISGLDFVRSLTKAPVIIFTTAYRNYAADGFDVDAADYLLKPISIDRFLRAVNKAMNIGPSIKDLASNNIYKRNFLLLKTDRGLVKIDYNQIYFFEAMENYVKVNLKDKQIISLNTMRSLEETLPPNFIRIHRSYIVNLEKIEIFQKNNFTIGNKNLTVGKNYRKIVAAYINQ